MPEHDLANLANLYDIVVPEPASLWWPLAPGWWAVIGLVFLALILIAWRLAVVWRRNAYRRQALAELDRLGDQPQTLPALLKRVALTTYPRSEIAALSGQSWVDFLNSGAPGCFDEQSGAMLESLAYQTPKEQDLRPLLDASRRWIEHHQAGKEAA